MNVSPQAKQATLSKLAQSREEIRNLLDPPRAQPSPGAGSGATGRVGFFPRSRTMRLLMSGRGVGTMGAMLGGLLMSRPMLAVRLIRMVPTGPLAKIALGKAFAAYRARRA